MILAIYHEAHREALLLFVSTQNNVHDRDGYILLLS